MLVNRFISRILIFLIVGICLFISGFLGLWVFIRNSTYFSFPGPFPDTWNGYNLISFIGLCIFTFLTLPGFFLIYISLRGFRVYLTSLGYRNIDNRFALFFFSFLILALSLSTYIWNKEILRCGIFFCTTKTINPEVPHHRPEAGIGFKVFTGMMIFILFFFFSLVLMTSLIVDILNEKKRSRYMEENSMSDDLIFVRLSEKTQPKVYHKIEIMPSRRLFFKSGFAVLFIIIFMYYLVSTVPNSWEYFSAPRLANYMSLRMYPPEECPLSNGMLCPELPWAWFKTVSLVIADRVLVMKFFPSSFFFYGYLFILTITAATTYQIQWSRKFLSRRLRVGMFNGFFSKFTMGELFLTFFTAILIFFWTAYWAQCHNFDGYWSPSQGDSIGFSTNEKIARVFGQLTILFYSLLLFPASKNSILHNLFGTRWESILWFHQLLGVLMLLSLVMHSIFWLIKYYQSGNLSDLIVVPFSSNFTIQLSILCTIVLLSVNILSYKYFRRKYFKFFYQFHLLAAYVSIPAVLWHAAAGWEYMMPGLTVLFMDKMIRIFRCGKTVIVDEVNVYFDSSLPQRIVSSGIIEIKFHTTGKFTVKPGQYVFINIPEISLLEWHPFSISSSGAESDNMSVHIKAQGIGSWTNRLFLYASKVINDNRYFDGANLSGMFQMFIDGPYGQSINFNDYKQIILIAGGIGITPIASMICALREYYEKYLLENSNPAEDINNLTNTYSTFFNDEREQTHIPQCTLRKLSLLWSIKDEFLFRTFIRLFPIQNATVNNLSYDTILKENIKIFNTGKNLINALVPSDGSLSIINGSLPCYIDELASLIDLETEPSDVLVFVCGPPSMVEDARKAALLFGCIFHSETFAL